MKISELLVGQSQTPVMAQQQQPVTEAAATMASHNIGALVVTDHESNIIGVISERDIAYALGNLGEAVLSSTVADLMTSNIVTIRPDETVEDAIYVFKAGLFRHLVVADRGKLIGVISIRDIVKNIAPLLLEAKGRLDDQKMADFLRALSAH
jgi:CBS domain-containing protein